MINVRLVQENPISARIKPEHGIKVLDHTVYLYDPSVIDDQVNLAKDWAIKMDGKVVEEGEEVDYSSKHYASEAKTSETNAASSASSASTSANLASGYANSASADAGTATTKASEAAASASSAATSASNASTSATNASNSASIAVAAATDPNVVAVGTNIQNINKVADNETNINTVVGMNEDISTVANISNYVADVGAISADVSTVASITSDVSTVSSHAADVVNVSENMDSVVSAVDYAKEAKVWAEGTDSEVEDYGGEKSSKGWAARAKEIVDSIGSVLHYKGSVATREDLPVTGQVIGDMYNILSDGSNVVWTGTGWDEISGVVDLSEYRKAADQDTIDAGKVPTSRTINSKALTSDITLTASDVGALPDNTFIPTDTSDLTNGAGYITGISSTDVTDALGYTPLKSSDLLNVVNPTTNVIPVKNSSNGFSDSQFKQSAGGRSIGVFGEPDTEVPYDKFLSLKGGRIRSYAGGENSYLLQGYTDGSTNSAMVAAVMSGNNDNGAYLNFGICNGSNTWAGTGVSNSCFFASMKNPNGQALKPMKFIVSEQGSGTPQLFIGTNNRVGIKTISPSYDLDVNGTINAKTSVKINGSNVALVSQIPTDTSDLTNGAGYITADSLPTTYVHEQGISSAVWTVQHNLNKYPSVTVVDSSENVIIADVEYVDVNTVKITMNGASKGRAYLN